MKSSEYITAFESPSVEEFSNLRNKIGWETTDFEMIKNSLEHSLFHVVIRDQFKLIGMGRIIGDGFMYFWEVEMLYGSFVCF